MIQTILPIFPTELTLINSQLGFHRDRGMVYYYNGSMPIYCHPEADLASFHFITAQMVILGNATQAEIVRAFGISVISMKRWVKRYREEGAKGFFGERRGRGPSVLTAEVLKSIQKELDEGVVLSVVAERMGFKTDTVGKAVRDGRLKIQEKKTILTTKSERCNEDFWAALGRGCTRVAERVEASFGALSAAPPVFQPALDVPLGGVLYGLPALLMNGLLRHTREYFSLPKGFYGLIRIFILLAFMALSRIKNSEGLRHFSPGELGKVVGLDRAPEVRALRAKVEYLATRGDVAGWCADLSREWLEREPELAGYLYVDGHVRVYHGSMTKLPKRYVARERLCLRGTMDYWVNDILGRPFFSITASVNPGLLEILRRDIIPRLIKDVPAQPSEEELARDPWKCRFAVLFDREGYSPAFFKEMWQNRIACYTYHKFPREEWEVNEFRPYRVTSPEGETVIMKLAERGTLLGQKIWVREIRKLTTTGHQTALVTTDFRIPTPSAAAAMFARWSQENFFRYMMQHYGLDRLMEYKTEPIPETTAVVNPAHRVISAEIRKVNAQLARKKALFGGLIVTEAKEELAMSRYEQQKALVHEEISFFEKELIDLKTKRKEIPRHIPFGNLPADQQFSALAHDKKQLADTIKMIAYRAETAMVELIKPYLATKREARALIRQLMITEADLLPDETTTTLTVAVHSMSNPVSDRAVTKLCDVLNSTETEFPGSKWRLFYKLVSD